MLGKLLKYDLKWNYKVIFIFYVLALFFSCLARLFYSIDNSVLFNIIGNICSSCAISMMISSLINTIMRSWARFMRNIYKDESYLTHTLPIEKKTIYLSKVLSSIICSFTTVAIIVLCLFICYYSKENLDVLKKMLEIAASTYDTTVIKLLFVLSFGTFLEIVFILLSGYIGIIIGHRSNTNKLAISFIWGFGFYIVTSIISLLVVFIIGLFNKEVMNMINTTSSINIDAIKMIMFIIITIYIIYDIVYYFIGKWQLNKGVNVD